MSIRVKPTFQNISKERFSKCLASAVEDLYQSSQASQKFFFFVGVFKWDRKIPPLWRTLGILDKLSLENWMRSLLCGPLSIR